jgi:hypothetical protein
MVRRVNRQGDYLEHLSRLREVVNARPRPA